jgi:hypothetical protein
MLPALKLNPSPGMRGVRANASASEPSRTAGSAIAMSTSTRQLRVLAYHLKEVEDALRAARLSDAADDLARAARLFGPAPAADFLDESRLALTNVLLGDRPLTTDVMASVLDAIAMIDDGFQRLGDA